MVTDFDEKHNEHLVLLQQRNRILGHLQRKDPIQIKLEQLEQGFTLYVNGAHSKPSTCRKKVSFQYASRSGMRTARANVKTEAKTREDAEARNTKSAPSKIQRKEWLQRAIWIKTESGSKLYAAPPVEYSEDFEPYESLNLESSNCDQNCLSQELQQSLKLDMSQDSDSVEEEVPAQPSLMEDSDEASQESPESFLHLTASSPVAGKSCHLIVLESNSPNLKKERVLSAQRRENAEAYILTKPAMVKSKTTRPLSAGCLKEERQEVALSRPASRSERPLSAPRKNVCEKKDPAHSVSLVLKAMQVENETLPRELLCRHQERSVSSQLNQAASTEGSSPSASAATEVPPKPPEGRGVSVTVNRIGLLGNRPQKKLLKVLQAIESPSASRDAAVPGPVRPEPQAVDNMKAGQEEKDGVLLCP